ncbi:MAG: SynChlorMet cassette protein ScmD [Methanotrichaceae archaeon]|nr:SynChlorMet cassette protein ScmD [Methanotrichaceae archaeon]
MVNNPASNPMIVLREEFDDWGLLFDPDNGNVTAINPVGVSVWRLLDGKRGIEDIVLEIKKRYSDVPDKASKEVETFIEDLADRGLIVDS